MSYLYHTLVYYPLYNGLIYLFDVFPWIDAGIAVIIFTIFVRLILFPLSKKSIVTQVRMKEIEPELNKLKQTVTDKQKQAVMVMELYKKKGVNPFSSFFLLLLQLPIIYTLYYIFVSSGLPSVEVESLYPFVNTPTINMLFLGTFDISKSSIFLSLCASAAQYFQLHYSLSSAPQSPSPSNAMNATQDMMKNMKYIFPVMIFLISYKVSAVVAVYWTVSSLFTLAQELVVRRHIKNHQPL
jgi:YidC/Oxa1 family membrane protein insertase